MYERCFALHERPFSLLPDPDFLFLSATHRAALDQLELMLRNECGFCVLSGGIGAGKTTLVRELLRRLGDGVAVGLVSNTHGSFGELMQWVLAAFGLQAHGDDRLEMQRRFVEFAIRRYAENKRTLLIIDEAQNLSPAAMEELRMLSNLNSDKDLVLQVILVGQSELRETLGRPELAQFAQRIGLDYHLGALAVGETSQYIRHRLMHAGGSAALFEPEACLMIHRASAGVPRLINRISDLSLVYAYAQARPVVTPAIVATVLRDQDVGGVFQSVPEPIPAEQTGRIEPGPQRVECAPTVPAPVAPPPPALEADKPSVTEDQPAALDAITDENASAEAVIPDSSNVPPEPKSRTPEHESSSAQRGAESGVRAGVEYQPAATADSSVGTVQDEPERQPWPGAARTLEHTPDASARETAGVDSELYQLVWNTELRPRAARRRAAPWVVSLAAVLSLATAGWMNRDRLYDLYSDQIDKPSRLAQERSGLTAAALFRPGASREPVPSQSRPPGPATALPEDNAGQPETHPADEVLALGSEPGVEDAARDDDAELQREMERLAALRSEAQRLERERRAEARKLAGERKARKELERKAQVEREKQRALQRRVADIAAQRARLAEQTQRLRHGEAQRAAGEDRDPTPASQPAPVRISEVAPLEPATITELPRQDEQAGPAGAQQDGETFSLNPCKGPAAKFMSTCF